MLHVCEGWEGRWVGEWSSGLGVGRLRPLAEARKRLGHLLICNMRRHNDSNLTCQTLGA